MKRREFVTLLGAAAGWPVAARAQLDGRVRRIGVLVGTAADDTEYQGYVSEFVQKLANFGWREGRELQIHYRWTEAKPDKMQAFARELVELRPDLILAHATPAVNALLRHTRSLPIVFVMVADPIASGLVTSLARPDGNITGFTNFESSMGGKWLEMLRDVAPHVKRILRIIDPTSSVGGLLQAIDAAASIFDMQLATIAARDAGEIERSINTFAAERNGGIVILPGNVTASNRELIVHLARQRRLPAVYPYRYFAVAGGLMSYGLDVTEHFREAADYVHRVLLGAKIADLPVQQPTKFQLVLNLRTATALGLDVPLKLHAFADEVIT
jgi:putative ABC transport system substrate-binding protein